MAGAAILFGWVSSVAPADFLSHFTVFVLAVGLGTIAVPSGIMATALSEARRDEEEKA